MIKVLCSIALLHELDFFLKILELSEYVFMHIGGGFSENGEAQVPEYTP